MKTKYRVYKCERVIMRRGDIAFKSNKPNDTMQIYGFAGRPIGEMEYYDRIRRPVPVKRSRKNAK